MLRGSGAVIGHTAMVGDPGPDRTVNSHRMIDATVPQAFGRHEVFHSLTIAAAVCHAAAFPASHTGLVRYSTGPAR